MTATEKDRLIEQLVETALDVETERRAAYLDEACRDRPDIRAEVESLLRCDEQATGFIERPAIQALMPKSFLEMTLSKLSPRLDPETRSVTTRLFLSSAKEAWAKSTSRTMFNLAGTLPLNSLGKALFCAVSLTGFVMKSEFWPD